MVAAVAALAVELVVWPAEVPSASDMAGPKQNETRGDMLIETDTKAGNGSATHSNVLTTAGAHASNLSFGRWVRAPLGNSSINLA